MARCAAELRLRHLVWFTCQLAAKPQPPAVQADCASLHVTSDIDHIAVDMSAVCRSTFHGKWYGDVYNRSNSGVSGLKKPPVGTTLGFGGHWGGKLQQLPPTASRRCIRRCMPLPRSRPQFSTSPMPKKRWSSLLKQLLRFDPRWTIRLTGHSRCIGIPGAQTGQRDFATGGSLQRGVLTELACVRMLLCLLGALPFGHKEAFLSNCQLRCMLNCFCD